MLTKEDSKRSPAFFLQHHKQHLLPFDSLLFHHQPPQKSHIYKKICHVAEAYNAYKK